MAQAKDGYIKFFGDVDFIKGKQSSTFPAYYFESLIREYEDRISLNRKKLDSGQIAPERVPQFKAKLEQDERKLAEIKNSKPKLSQAERDMCWKVYKGIGSKIAEQMPTLSDMKRGTADAHVEAKRMKEACISLDNEMKKVAKSMNIKVVGSKISRDSASKIFKIVGKLLNEPTNIEVLRRDRATGTYQPTHETVANELR